MQPRCHAPGNAITSTGAPMTCNSATVSGNAFPVTCNNAPPETHRAPPTSTIDAPKAHRCSDELQHRAVDMHAAPLTC